MGQRRPPGRALRAACRRFLAGLVLGLCGIVLLYAFALAPYQVPTGSMAPTLRGQHRTCVCPCCGAACAIGRHPSDPDGRAGPRCYRRAACPNCGAAPLPVGNVPETNGDHVLVCKTAFALRAPRRWEVVVFRLFGLDFIKRLIGLPGESIELRDGDVFVDDRLVRKSLAQARALRVPLFEQRQCPEPRGWQDRWESAPATAEPAGRGPELVLDGRATPTTLTYRNFLLETGQSEPITDEVSYNAGAWFGGEEVHDFWLVADVEICAGTGSFTLGLCDGQDWAEVELLVGAPARPRVRVEPLNTPQPRCAPAAQVETCRLVVGRRYHIEAALVDRRLGVAINGALVLSADLPEASVRAGVVRPARLRADGVTVALRNLQLYRDVHYAQRGSNGVGGRPVHLGAGQYFVLGDNSAASEDSRFWTDGGRVPAGRLVGRALLVHLPSRRLGGVQLPDVPRVRWLR